MTCALTLSEKFTAADKSLRCFYLLNKSFPTLHNQKRSWVLIRFFKPVCNASSDEKKIWTPAISPGHLPGHLPGGLQKKYFMIA